MPLEPINYMINQPNQGNNFMEGLQIGQALKQIGAQREAERQAAELKVQYASDLKSAFDNPTPESFAMLSTKYPTQREAFKQSFEMLEAPKKAAELQTTGQVYTALLNNKPEIANGIINEQIAALENSGKDASKLKQIKDTIEQDPQTATGIAGFMLSNMMGQKEFKDYQDALGTAGKETREKTLFPEKQAQEAIATQKAGYETAIKEEEAKITPKKLQADLRKTIAEAKKFELEPQLEQQKIAIERQKVAVARETNSIERDKKQIELMKLTNDFSDKINEKKASVQSAADNALNIKQTIKKALTYFDPKTKNWSGGSSAAARAHGTIAALTPTYDQDTADYEELLKTVGSQAFIAMVPTMKGTGNLSEKEGDKLQTAMQSLSLRQSATQAKKNLETISILSQKALKTAETKFGIKPSEVRQNQRSSMSNSDVSATLGI